MFFKFREWLWGIVADLEYLLYPYDMDPIDEYNIKVKDPDTGELYMVKEWIQNHDQKIERIQDEMIWVISEIHKLNALINDERMNGQE